MPTLAPAPTPRWHLWFFPCLGLAGLGLPWTHSPSTCAFGKVGSPPLSLLRLGLSWQLGLGTKFACRVGGVLAALHTPLPLSACSAHGERKAGLPAHQVFLLSLAAAGASLFGVFERSWGLDPKRHRVRLSVSVGLHLPIRHCPLLCSLLIRDPQRDAPLCSGSTFSPRISLPWWRTDVDEWNGTCQS